MTEYKVSKSNLQKSIHGSVRHQGLPVAGIEIRLYSQHETDSMSGQSPTDKPISVVESGEKGEYEFNVPFGCYSILAIPRSDSRLLKQSIFDINLEKGGINCDISLKPGFLLEGQVRTASGDTVKDGEVFALGVEPSPYWCSSKIDAKGNFTLVLPKGKFHLGTRSSATGLFGIINAPVSNNNSNFYFLSKQVQSVEIYKDQYFEMVLPELSRFRGELVDPLGNPIEGARVSFTPKDVEESPALNEFCFSSSSLTDGTGQFEIHLENGIFDLDVVPTKESKQFGISETDLKVAGPTEKRFTLEEGHKLSGRVLYKGEPLPNCKVRIQAIEAEREFIAESNEVGEFAASIPPGVYNLLVSAESGQAKVSESDDEQATEIAPWTKEIVVGGDTHVGIKLRSGIELSGAIKDDSGNPKTGIKVSVFAQTKNNQDGLSEENLGRILAQTTTDSQGKFSISLVRGKYWLVVHKDFESARKVEIDSKPLTVDISWHGWCQVGFRVEGEDGAEVPRCKVIYEPYKMVAASPSNNKLQDNTDHPSGYVITDRYGVCKLTIPSGIYSFKFSPPMAGSYAPKEIRQLSIISDSTKKVALGLKK